MKKNLTALRTVVVGAVTALGLSLAVAPASAGPIVPLPDLSQVPGISSMPQTTPNGKQIVTFGDSFTAHAGKNGPRALEPGQMSLVSNCATDQENWPKLTAAQLGKTVGDWSCNGTGIQLAAYLEAAIQYGDLGPDTEEVVLMYGGLDWFYQFDAGVALVNPAAVTDASIFRQELRIITDRIREVAPKARISMSSYVDYISGDMFCPVNYGPVVTPISVPGATHVQNTLRDLLRDTANFVGANFIDVYQQTQGHGTCHPDPAQRYAVGFIDSTEHTMPVHPSNAGHRAVANVVAGELSA